MLVGRGSADVGVDDEEHSVGEIDGDLGLGSDGCVDASRVGLPAAGVDDREAAPVPLGLVVNPVAGHAGGVFDDGLATTDDAVDERGLAHVRPPDDRKHRKGRKKVIASGSSVDRLEDVEVLVVELIVLTGRCEVRPRAGRRSSSSSSAGRETSLSSSSGMSSEKFSVVMLGFCE